MATNMKRALPHTVTSSVSSTVSSILSKRSCEISKSALRQDLGKGVLKSLMHLFPISITVAILSLSWRTIYWKDLGDSHLNTYLSALQFAAKFHELLLVASLSAIALHRVRHDLIEGEGVPLGLLTSAYRITSVAYFFSLEFWGASIRKWIFEKDCALPLPLFIGIIILLTAVVGPSSAVILIPKLSWWPATLYNARAVSTIIPIGVNDLWPTVIDVAESMDVSVYYDNRFYRRSDKEACEQLLSYQNNSQPSDFDLGEYQLCPTYGLKDINTWQISYMSQHSTPNFTILDTLSNTLKYLTASSNNTYGYSVSSTVTRRQARDLGSFWQYLDLYENTFIRPNRPLLSMSASLPGQYRMPLLKPVVQSKCVSYTSENSSAMTIPDGELRHSSSERVVSFPLPRNLKLSEPSNSVMDFHWVLPPSDFDDNALIGAVFRTFGWNSDPVLHACGVVAHWVPVSVRIDPAVSLTIYQDSPDPIELINATFREPIPKARPLRMSKEWLDSMNLGPYPSWHFVNLTLMESLGAEFGYRHREDYQSCPGKFCLDQGDIIPWLLASSVSLYLADGLSRVNSGLETQIFRKDGKGTSWHNLNSYNQYDQNGSEYLRTALGSNSSHNTEVHWHTRRFGYGWGINGPAEATFIIAAMMLLLQALIALVHIGFMTVNRWVESCCCENMGEMVALALQSPEPPPDVLDNTSAGVKTPRSWREMVRAQEGLVQKRTHAGDQEVANDGVKYRLELHAGYAGKDAAEGHRSEFQRVVRGRKYH